VPRTSKDDLEFCRKYNACLDCYSVGLNKSAVKIQTRGKLKVPCCVAHSNAYKSKLSMAGARKYRRSSEAKEQAGRCVYKGCHRKLIPRELLPPWIRERTCGMHGAFKAFRINRAALLRFITEHCLTDEERKGTPQSIIYKPGSGFVFVKLRYDNRNETTIRSAPELLEQYLKFLRK
jgi:hypothetical protein